MDSSQQMGAKIICDRQISENDRKILTISNKQKTMSTT